MIVLLFYHIANQTDVVGRGARPPGGERFNIALLQGDISYSAIIGIENKVTLKNHGQFCI